MRCLRLAGSSRTCWAGSDRIDNNFFLELDFGNEERTHNWVYFTQDVSFLQFDLNITARSDNDILEVRVGQAVVETLELTSTSTSVVQLPVDPFRGEIKTITFELRADGFLNIIDSEVQIDNLLMVSAL